MPRVVVAIDGPSGVGKSSVSKLLAKELNASYIDTGAMYRAVALGISDLGIKVDETGRIEKFLNSMEFVFKGERVFLNKVDLTEKIREGEAGALASKYSSLPVIRGRLVEMQRSYVGSASVVMEGRDITTVVLPGADIKFFLTASPKVRAKRRLMDEKNTDGREIEEIAQEINLRDERDSTRKDSLWLRPKTHLRSTLEA